MRKILSIAAITAITGCTENTVLFDQGGLVSDRIERIQAHKSSGEEVRIAGLCASSCIMLLALGNVCVEESATFVFHGPSKSGEPLEPGEYAAAVRLIAEYYPPSIADWYVSSGHSTTTFMTGTEVIDAGVDRCD